MSNQSTTQGLRRGRAFWMDIIADFERSPCTHAEFVERHDLTLSAFRSWLYRLREEGTSWDGAAEEEFNEAADDEAHFVEVVAAEAQGLLAVACTIEAGPVRIHFREPPTPAYVAELLREVG